MHPLTVRIEDRADAIMLSAEDYRCKIEVEQPRKWLGDQFEFAAFLFLPVAMRSGRSLIVEGAGDDTAAANAVALSKIWNVWKPELFHQVDVRFANNHKSTGSSQRSSRTH